MRASASNPDGRGPRRGSVARPKGVLPLHSTQVASETWTIARMRAFLESRGTKGRPHAVVGGPGPESGEDPWEFARGEYRTAREGVERDDMRASDKAGRAWNVTWDQERFVVPFLRSEMASRAVDARRTLLFANCVALDRWLRARSGPPRTCASELPQYSCVEQLATANCAAPDRSF